MRVAVNSYKPILGYNFKVIFSKLESEDAFVTFAKAVTLPSMDNNPILLEYGNTYAYVKGKTRWNEVTMTLYAMSKPHTHVKLWNYLQKHQDTKEGTDQFKVTYMGDVQIQILLPNEVLFHTWTLINAHISSINFGSMDWSSDDVVQPEISLVYDYAKYS